MNSVIPQDDPATVEAMMRQVWSEFHQPLHPCMGYDAMRQHVMLNKIVMAHALLNLSAGQMPRSVQHEKQPDNPA